MSKQWEAAETGNYDELPAEKKNTECYIEMRRDMIRAALPGMSAESLDLCARETRGLYGKRILDWASGFQQSGAKPPNPRRHLVCHPVSGEFEEYPLNPALVNEMLSNAGFEPKLRSPHYGPFGGRFRALKALAAAAFRLCPPLLRWGSPTFAVVASVPPGPIK